jgi:hypothetical protein
MHQADIDDGAENGLTTARLRLTRQSEVGLHADHSGLHADHHSKCLSALLLAYAELQRGEPAHASHYLQHDPGGHLRPCDRSPASAHAETPQRGTIATLRREEEQRGMGRRLAFLLKQSRQTRMSTRRVDL